MLVALSQKSPGVQPRTSLMSSKYGKVMRSFPLLLLWSLIFLNSSFKFLIFALHCCKVRTQRRFCSGNIWFKCFEMRSETEELYLLLIGKYSFYTEISNRTFRGPNGLLLDFSLIWLPSSWLMRFAADCTCGPGGRASRWICCQWGKIIVPRGMIWSPSDGSTNGVLSQIRVF